jgi:hypothetical protein
MILQSLFLNATPKHFKFPTLPKFQAMYQLGHDFLMCDIAGEPLEYTVTADMWPSIHNYIIIITMAATCFRYKLAIIRRFMWEEIIIHVVYIYLKMISGRYPDLTYKGIWLLYVKKCSQYKSNRCIKWKPTDATMVKIYISWNISTCFGHHYAHHQDTNVVRLL